MNELIKDFRHKLPELFLNRIVYSVDFLVKTVPDVEEIYLFGSCARGDAKWSSDVDLAVVTKKVITDHTLRGTVISILDEPDETETCTDVIFRTPDMQDGSITFQKLFDRDKVLIWKKDYE